MLKITTPYGFLKLPHDIEIPLTITNPMVNERGSYSLPFTVPEKPNREALGFPASLSRKTAVGEYIDCVVEHGVFKEKGTLKITDVTSNIELSLTTREGAFWEWAKKTKLRSIETREARTIDFVNERETYFNNIWPTVEMAFFPIAVRYLGEDHYIDQTSWNSWCYTKYCASDYIITNNPSDLFRDDYADFENGGYVSGYITGFLYVNEVILWIAKTYGFKINENFMASSEELRRSVVLNNAPESSYTSSYEFINYTMLLPNVTVMDFIDSIEKAFGCVFLIGSSKRDINIRSLNSTFRALNKQFINASVNLKTPFDPKGLSIKAQRSNSPYITVNDRAIDNSFFIYITQSASLIHDKIYQTLSTPDYVNYPNKFVLCTSTQAFFRLYWVDAGDNWEYKAECMHSNYHDLVKNDQLTLKNIDCKFTLSPMVPVTCRQFYKNPNNAYFDMNFVIPHFDGWDVPLQLTDGFISYNNDESPITFAFYRGRIDSIAFPVEIFGITGFNFPIGTVDIYNKSGDQISGASLGMRIAGAGGIYENFYKHLEEYLLKSGVEVDITNINLNELLSKDLFAPITINGSNILLNELNVTLKLYSKSFDSATGYTLKPYN